MTWLVIVSPAMTSKPRLLHSCSGTSVIRALPDGDDDGDDDKSNL